MTSTKANGDPLEGSIVTPSNYPNPVLANVNMHPMNAAYHVDGNYSGETQQQKDEDV